MKSSLTVNTAADSHDLTTLATVKAELDITDGKSDAKLKSYITQASDMAEQECRRIFVLETVTETFWPFRCGDRLGLERNRTLILARAPVASITSVTVDGTVIDPSLYRLDEENGLLYRLDTFGFAVPWCISQSAVIVYSGGYEPSDIPPGVERAVLQWVVELYRSKGRDPRLKSENVTGVGSQDFWVGQVDAGTLSPEKLLERYRRQLPLTAE